MRRDQREHTQDGFVFGYEITEPAQPAITRGHPDNHEPGNGASFEVDGIFADGREWTWEDVAEAWDTTEDQARADVERAIAKELDR